MSMMFLFTNTICLSFIIKIINKIRINIDIKNTGYKINKKKKLEDLKQTSNLILLIPVINLIMVLKDTIKYSIKKEKIFKSLIENKNLIKDSKEKNNENEISLQCKNTDCNTKNNNDIYNKPLNKMSNAEKIQALKELKKDLANENEQNILENKIKIK